MADKLVDNFLGISHIMAYLKIKNGMDALMAPGSKVYKNMQKANQLRITTFFMKSSCFTCLWFPNHTFGIRS